jgi:hypothetical protein
VGEGEQGQGHCGDELFYIALGRIGDIVLLADSAGIGGLNSMVAPMAVVNALLNGVAEAKGKSALQRYSRHDRWMHRWDAFLLKLGDSD